jgi:phenylpropionate dioxygenase-like ring-hydroxylating dioxygenase large terminal subunit
VVGLRLDNCSPALRACWHPVAQVEDIQGDPVGVRVLGEPWVVARLDGVLVALADRCPHRGAPLSAGCVVGTTLRCPYHGWRYGADGRCIEIPALGAEASIPPRARVAPARVVEHGSLVWLAPEPPRVPLPPLPATDRPVQFLVTDWAASAAHLMDNFLDIGHLSFVHADSFGVAGDAASVDMEIVREGWTLTVTHDHVAKLVDSDEWALGTAQPFARRHVFRYDAPFTLRLDISYEDLADQVTLVFAVQPVDRERSRLYSMAIRNETAATRCTPEEGIRRGMMIIDEDREVLERVRERSLELDPAAELHTRADRNTLALRRLLADLVASAALPEPVP